MSRQRIIIDTDPGVDDAIAILLALASPELEVLGITAVAGNVPLNATLANACKIVALSGRSVPVFAGAPGPLMGKQVYGRYAHVGAFSDDLMPATERQPQAESAVTFIVRQARQAVESGELLTLCAIGPMTNLALALVQDPLVSQGISRIVTMSCAFTALGHRVPWAEFNVYADPHAADVVFNSGIPLTVMPLDMTFQALVTRDHIQDFEQRGGAAGRAVAALLRRFDRSDIKRYGREGGPVHDATTIAWLLAPQLFSGVQSRIGVATSGPTAGYTWADFHCKQQEPPNADVMQTIDESGFLDLLSQRLAVYGGSET
ncbi:nucleoside hydrolase [Erwinia sp. OLTSP20]|uniref:nucleoside hydrolase n=1 Tax=unclassified Erwinia TaxID=2622719 RepID=UPI000C17A04A|nr:MULTISPECIES: nucleoside hydrolase [unclassified Erwinia]PIJ51174.1 nucleoside hydrolase [Erwinia sp. OAMSP11]PIJ73926.1 nucleoside hydrolase [Erwinia sp. OLSSP12]PIJ83934.1 nucleoside hydrolase [Erwinia sp. OLCASP19]PIJ86464.1 nucleoside hydrolase [Erwinia sp. OLMTSP26]PIJ87943.1 nucleoside hydrolase [Erwinia sp. OLMDSP33]